MASQKARGSFTGMIVNRPLSPCSRDHAEFRCRGYQQVHGANRRSRRLFPVSTEKILTSCAQLRTLHGVSY
ncbi:hypothetical protein M413DRAFT_319851 [Hebeloma cylindrosporum]|uniref:Uncharacterized protein n=1 Tax=Hebeloma cylindrosporum TaxID=76867 RepID=A0A0C3BXX0_HEBCY|nr:hypothetical protein M413DRAFT_319851 [Hebeloma cylindrosporum h7]